MADHVVVSALATVTSGQSVYDTASLIDTRMYDMRCIIINPFIIYYYDYLHHLFLIRTTLVRIHNRL